jgi:hypothetical protein
MGPTTSAIPQGNTIWTGDEVDVLFRLNTKFRYFKFINIDIASVLKFKVAETNITQAPAIGARICFTHPSRKLDLERDNKLPEEMNPSSFGVKGHEWIG